jgi:prepilin-type N-terminal cleavage/methylation domain-containing protein
MVLARSRWTGNQSGFSLIEVLVATTIMIVAVVSLAQLFVVATNANKGARATTMAALLAQQKLEQLRSLEWGFDTLGLPLSDTTTDTSTVPESATGGKGLSPSPSSALSSNTVGYVDYLDAYGVSVGGTSSTPPAEAVFIRRWSIEPLPTNPNNTLVLQVLVTRSRNRGAADTATGVTRLPDEARLISVKTRKAT